MQENEELYLIEKDQGDGWTRVRRMNGEYEEGFVPTSYIETTVFDTWNELNNETPHVSFYYGCLKRRFSSFFKRF